MCFFFLGWTRILFYLIKNQLWLDKNNAKNVFMLKLKPNSDIQ